MFAKVIVLALGDHLCNVCYINNALKCISHIEVPFPPMYINVKALIQEAVLYSSVCLAAGVGCS
jgi:hypothetical protein